MKMFMKILKQKGDFRPTELNPEVRVPAEGFLCCFVRCFNLAWRCLPRFTAVRRHSARQICEFPALFGRFRDGAVEKLEVLHFHDLSC